MHRWAQERDCCLMEDVICFSIVFYTRWTNATNLSIVLQMESNDSGMVYLNIIMNLSCSQTQVSSEEKA